MSEMLPTLGNLINACDGVLSDVRSEYYPSYAKCFAGTLIERVVLAGNGFEEAARLKAHAEGLQEKVRQAKE